MSPWKVKAVASWSLLVLHEPILSHGTSTPLCGGLDGYGSKKMQGRWSWMYYAWPPLSCYVSLDQDIHSSVALDPH